MCDFAKGCKSDATFVVIHKAAGAMKERHVDACRSCASKIGQRSPEGPIIDSPDMDSTFYRLVKK